MSERELQRVEVLAEVAGNRRTIASAAAVLALGTRQVHRLLQAYRRGGSAALAHKARGRPSNNRISDGVRARAIELVRSTYPDFGPTLAAEMLAEKHELKVSRETLRGWLLEAGLWLSRKQRRRFHQPRQRRESYGELVQIDGSEHRWFEDRADPCTLLVFIDDATGRLMRLLFVRSENAFAYFEALHGYLESHGRPVAFYSDKHSVFRVARQDAKGGQGMTQFGRALAELNIEILCAHSSQAKGRVERVNRTLQDRLVKELRLAGISDIEAGNAFLPGFMARFNARFAVAPARAGGLAGQYVDTYAFADGRLEIRWQGLSLPYRAFDKDQRVTHAAIVENKRLGEVLAFIKNQQDLRSPPRPKTNSETIGYRKTGRKSPGRKSFVDKMFERRNTERARAAAG
jgi:transposase